MDYYLEVSYEIPKGIFYRDKEIVKKAKEEYRYSTCSFGWRNLIFVFDDSKERNDCFDRLKDLKQVCISIYEKSLFLFKK